MNTTAAKAATKGGALVLKGAGAVYQSFHENPTQLAAFHGIPVNIAERLVPLVKNGQTDEVVKLLLAHPEWIYLWELLYGGIRSGKTFAICLRAWLAAANSPGMKILVVRKRHEQLRNTFLDEFEKVGRLISDDHLNYVGELQSEKNGAVEYEVFSRNPKHPSKVIFAIEPDATEDEVKKRWLGYTIGAGVTEETPQLKEITGRMLVTRVSQPVDADGHRIPFWMATICNPVKKTHWIGKLKMENEVAMQMGERPYCLVIRSRPSDNKHLPAGWVETQREMLKGQDHLIQAWLEGEDEIETVGKPVYGAQFSDKLHVDSQIKFNPYLPLLRGWDFGYHRPACVWLQEDVKGNINVLYELLGEDETAEQFADRVRTLTQEKFQGVPSIKDYGDPAGAQQTDKGDSTIAILARKGIRINFRPTQIMPGVKHVRAMLTKMRAGRPELVFSPACPILIDGFKRGYHFKEFADSTFSDKPHKDGYYDHLCDAIRYCLVNIRAIPFEFESDPGSNVMQAKPMVAGGMSPLDMT